MFRSFLVKETPPYLWNKHWNWKAEKAVIDSEILPMLDAWAAGKIEDPYKGKAWHWGSKQDPKLKNRLKKLPGFGNYFYGDQ